MSSTLNILVASLGGVILLTLSGCENYHTPRETYDLASTANANARLALSQIDDLRSRNAELERRLDSTQRFNDSLFAYIKAVDKGEESIRKAYNYHLRTLHGMAAQ